MKVNMYSVFDKVAGVYNQPQFLISDEVALRHVRAIMRDAESMFALFPDDFKLVKLGSVDLDHGTVTADEVKTLCDGFKALLASNDGGKL